MGYTFRLAPDLLSSLADHMAADEPSPMLTRTDNGVDLRWNSMSIAYLPSGVRIDLRFNERTIAYMDVPLGHGDTLELADLSGGLDFRINDAS